MQVDLARGAILALVADYVLFRFAVSNDAGRIGAIRVIVLLISGAGSALRANSVADIVVLRTSIANRGG
jgi:hypothetical protein